MPRNANKTKMPPDVKIAALISIAINRVAWLGIASKDMPALTRFFWQAVSKHSASETKIN